MHRPPGTATPRVAPSCRTAPSSETRGAAYHPSDYVFTREDGLPYHPEYLSKVYQRLATRAGMRTTKLHGHAPLPLISTGADIAVVSKELGHSSITVTSDIYGHLFDKAAKNMAMRAAKLVPRGTKAAKKPDKTKRGRKAAGGNPDSKAA